LGGRSEHNRYQLMCVSQIAGTHQLDLVRDKLLVWSLLPEKEYRSVSVATCSHHGGTQCCWMLKRISRLVSKEFKP
jgi:hypothetical protein